MAERESSAHVAKYLLVGSTAIEFILALWGFMTSDIGYKLLEYIISEPSELLYEPTKKRTDPE